MRERVLRGCFSVLALAVAAAFAVTGWAGAQQIPATAPSQGAAVEAPASGAKLPSALLQPGIEAVRGAMGGIRLDKWKASEAVRDEADANRNSIQKDLDATLPGLLASADAAPNSVVAVMPVYRNVEALYDVLLRIAAAAHIAAPTQQSGALDAAMLSLDSGRRGLAERIQISAAATEKQVGDLQASLKAAKDVPAPVPVACPAPAPVKKKKPVVKTAAKPAPTPQGAGGSH
ncbi:MAG: hypothetical protein JWM43_2794 [Acidobacteriaceae bacterium]|nr:hypothetical protein [Acidobacteriaceae bacterium]